MKQTKENQSQKAAMNTILRKNLGMIPGILCMTGTALTFINEIKPYNINFLFITAVMFLASCLTKKLHIMEKLSFYFFSAMSTIMFLLICAFRLSFRAPFLLSPADWGIVIMQWVIIFSSSVILDALATEKQLPPDIQE